MTDYDETNPRKIFCPAPKVQATLAPGQLARQHSRQTNRIRRRAPPSDLVVTGFGDCSRTK